MTYATKIVAFDTTLTTVGGPDNLLIHGHGGRVAAACHIGKRPKQEDDLLIYFNPLTGELTVIVEDGMGGHGNGEIAARLFKEGAQAALLQNKNFAQTLRAAEMAVLGAANDALQGPDVHLSDMGLVFVAAQFMVGSQGIDIREVAWKGDARGYLIRSGTNALIPLTWDHTHLSMQYLSLHGGELGPTMDAEAYYRFIQQHRRLGTVFQSVYLPDNWDPHQPDTNVEPPNTLPFPVQIRGGPSLTSQPGDIFLYCSDGALVLPFEKLKQILTSQQPLVDRVVELRDTAIATMDGPDRDNLTIALVEDRA